MQQDEAAVRVCHALANAEGCRLVMHVNFQPLSTFGHHGCPLSQVIPAVNLPSRVNLGQQDIFRKIWIVHHHRYKNASSNVTERTLRTWYWILLAPGTRFWPWGRADASARHTNKESTLNKGRIEGGRREATTLGCGRRRSISNSLSQRAFSSPFFLSPHPRSKDATKKHLSTRHMYLYWELRLMEISFSSQFSVMHFPGHIWRILNSSCSFY